MNFAEAGILDATTLKDYLHCPRKYYYRHVRGLAEETTGMALYFGIAVHEGLELAYKWLKDNPHSEWDAALVQAAKDRARSYYETSVDPDVLLTEDLRTPGKLDAVLHAYFNKYVLEPFTVVEVERPFYINVNHDGSYVDAGWDTSPWLTAPTHRGLLENRKPVGGWSWVGRMDLVVNWDGGLRVIDHKTTWQMGVNFGNQWSPEAQMAGYIQALELLFEGQVPVFGAAINAIQVAKTQHGLGRYFTTRRADELEVHRRSLKAWTDVIKRDEIYPQNTTACNLYNKDCPYKGLCQQYPLPDTQLAPDEVPPGYVYSVWSPLDHLIKKGGGEGA